MLGTIEAYMNSPSTRDHEARQRKGGRLPYLVVGLAWWAFLMIALTVRMNEPIFLWVLTQGLLIEKVSWSQGFWSSRALLLAVYMLAAIAAWWLVERGDRDPSHVWRRAIVAWIGIQALYCLAATLLVRVGLLYE